MLLLGLQSLLPIVSIGLEIVDADGCEWCDLHPGGVERSNEEIDETYSNGNVKT